MPGYVPRCPGRLKGPLLTSSAHTGFFIVIHLGLFESADGQFLHFGYSSPGKLGFREKILQQYR